MWRESLSTFPKGTEGMVGRSIICREVTATDVLDKVRLVFAIKLLTGGAAMVMLAGEDMTEPRTSRGGAILSPLAFETEGRVEVLVTKSSVPPV